MTSEPTLIERLRMALAEIADLTHRQQLPITYEIHNIARTALEAPDTLERPDKVTDAMIEAAWNAQRAMLGHASAPFPKSRTDCAENFTAIYLAMQAARPTPVPDGGLLERDATGETVCGFRVAAWRETHPEHGDKYGWRYSEHWSTPSSRDPRVTIERLFTEEQLRAALTPTQDTVSLGGGNG